MGREGGGEPWGELLALTRPTALPPYRVCLQALGGQTSKVELRRTRGFWSLGSEISFL